MNRVYNFSAGPSQLPLCILEEAQREFEEEQKRKKEKQQKLLKILTQKTTRGKDKGR